MGKLLAGVVQRNITPNPEIIKLINQEGRYNYKGIHDELFLTVIVLTDGEKKFAYFGSDISTFPVNETLVAALKERFGLEPKDCMFSGTRSHNTVSGGGNQPYEKLKPGTRAYVQFMHGTILAAVEEAIKNLVPARIGAAVGESRINAHRELRTPAGNFEGVNHTGPHAPWLRVVRLEDLSGKTLALMVNYSMHCCTLAFNQSAGEFDYVSADIAGAVERYLERAGKHQYPAAWSVGGGSDQIPLMFGSLDRCEVDDEGVFSSVRTGLPPEVTLGVINQLACEQGLNVLRTIQEIKNYSDAFDYFSTEAFADVPAKKALYPRLIMYKPGVDDVTPEPVDEPVHYRFGLAVIDGIAFCAASAATYSGMYQRVKDMLPFDVTLLFDDSPYYTSSIPVPEAEEQDWYSHGALQSRNFTARQGANAMLCAFAKMAEEYVLAKKY